MGWPRKSGVGQLEAGAGCWSRWGNSGDESATGQGTSAGKLRGGQGSPQCVLRASVCDNFLPFSAAHGAEPIVGKQVEASTISVNVNVNMSESQPLQQMMVNLRTPPRTLNSRAKSPPMDLDASADPKKMEHRRGHSQARQPPLQPRDLVRAWDSRPASTSRSSRPSSTASSPPGREQRLSSVLVPKPPSMHRQTASITTSSSNRWSSRSQQRESYSSRLASMRRDVAESMADSQGRLSMAANDVQKPDRMALGVAQNPDDGLVSEICHSIVRDRYSTDPDSSTKALRIWNAVTACLDEINDSIEGTSSEDTLVNGRHARTATRTRHARRISHDRDPWRGRSSGDGDLSNPGHGKEMAEAPAAGERVQYQCPFRKRNPVRFNVRDHESCARTPFHSISGLRVFRCRRCRSDFESEASLDSHIMQPREYMCELRSAPGSDDPEDGVTDGVYQVLAREKDEFAGWTWDKLWRAIFPGSEEIPNSVTELVEFEQEMANDQESLKSELQEKLRLLLPNSIEDDFCHFLAGQLEFVFETHQANVTRKCLNNVDSTRSEQSAATRTRPNSTQQEGILKRQSRRSRQSTLLQTTVSSGGHRRTPSDKSDAARRQSRRGPRDDQPTHPTKTARRLPSLSGMLRGGSQSPPLRLAAASGATSSPGTMSSSSNTAFDSDNNDVMDCSADDYANGRDSRDSGIGIPCDVCEMESCRCREMILSYAAEDKADGRKPRGHTQVLQASSPPPPPTANASQKTKEPASTFSLRRQTNLRIKTGGIGFRAATLTDGDADGKVFSPGGGGGAFSPQSFKQRLLRKQHTPSFYGAAHMSSWTA
ncbi:hypothetical protein B0T26DRAFT_679449 [Lasiosphaeria miniovina]|uniref:C2H2-type domain-containing protein n=1 Tax=Lasiosphaeria miniovina TaxID=1954250 RepID=A0AA40A6I3_9PEZI|nr:uncharacterized protein B0T26DRAFT_679449 [Lasiosphaeria miniovina]KAK0710130.1 hypothetical protein B0T26DRAFT_679449 [Lasiosphaeria miniovina]